MDNQYTSLVPTSFDVSRLPKDFGTGRLQDLLVTFDNLERQSHFKAPSSPFPVKCESVFSIIILKGSIDIRINLHEQSIHEGEFLVMMPGCIFEAQKASEDMRFCGFIIESDFWETMRKSIGIYLDLTKRYHTFMLRQVAQTALDKQVLMYEMIRNELNTKDHIYKKEVIQRFCEIWALNNIALSDNVEGQPDLKKPLNRKEEIFHDFLSVLEKYYKQERSISFYADQMCLTPKYLSTIIKEVSGKHGMQWIDEYVALEAKALLRNSTLSVKQVADQLNFPSQSMFGRFFKKMTGCSPKQYKLM